MKARRIERVILYDEGAAETLDIEELAEYLTDRLSKAKVAVRGGPFAFHPETSEDWARKLASFKIQNVNQKVTCGQEPLYGEVQYEKRRILGKTRSFGVLYDGFYLHRVFSELIPGEERGTGFAHIFFTNRLFASWEESNRRYHARTSVYGFPSIISTTGLVEAPAKPREYYLAKQQFDLMGRNHLELKARFKGRFIDYDDARLTEVMKGYVMQAILYSSTGNPFCKDKGCRLYNAHWQEELIFAQLESEYEFCPRHTEFLEREL